MYRLPLSCTLPEAAQKQPFVPFKVLPANFPGQILPNVASPGVHFWEEPASDALHLTFDNNEQNLVPGLNKKGASGSSQTKGFIVKISWGK